MFPTVGQSVFTVGQELMKKREYFSELVLNSGVAPPSNNMEKKKFDNVVDKVFLQFSVEATSCVNPSVAQYIFNRAKALIGTATRMHVSSLGLMVDLDGLLPGAFSNKSILELVVKEGVPCVFKFATDSQFQDSIDRDIHYSTVFKNISGLVVYERFTIPKSVSEHYYCGSISKVYVFSLNKLSTFPLSPLLLKKIIFTVSNTFKRVHGLGYVFNDLKPDNIYMDSNGDIDIGDFGGVTEIGKAFLEITVEYIPADLVSSNTSIPLVDKMCLVNTVLQLSNCSFGGETCKENISRVKNIQSEEVRLCLMEIFSAEERKQFEY